MCRKLASVALLVLRWTSRGEREPSESTLRRNALMILGLLIALLALVAFAGCGGTVAQTTSTDSPSTTAVTMPTTSTSTTAASSSSSSTTTRQALLAYRDSLHAWNKQYDSYSDEQGAALASIFYDPLNATAEQIAALRQFAVDTNKMAESFNAIQPPADMLDVHQAFAGGLSDLARSTEGYAQALERRDASGLDTAAAALSTAADRLDQAQVDLEQAAGTLLSSQ
jgi:cytoskeletal protein RodZ